MIWRIADAAQVIMPSLSPTMQRGTIVKWYKQEGQCLSRRMCLAIIFRRYGFCHVSFKNYCS